MSEQTVLVARHGDWTQLTLNRPDRLNSFNETMHKELSAAIADIAADEGCRAVLRTGAGRGVGAGQD